MNKNKFLSLLMGECWHEWEWKPKDGDIHIYECAKCGLRVGGRPQHPDHLSNPLPVIDYLRMNHFDDIWVPWIRKEFEGVDGFHIPYMLANFFNWPMDNLIKYLSANREWGEKECPNCSGTGAVKCTENTGANDGAYIFPCICNGTGIIKHPALIYLEGCGVG